MRTFERLESRELLSATGESYLIFDHWDFGSSWHDADKTWSGDRNLCWAATASNVLAWGGWHVGEMDTADEIFAHMKDHSADVGSMPGVGWYWWFEGGDNPPLYNGVGYFPGQLDAARIAGRMGSGAMADLHYMLQFGYGIGMCVGGAGAHAVTCWGVNYDPVTGEYLGIWITDSDDRRDGLRYYEVQQEGSTWYLQNYYGTNTRTWKIEVLDGLAGNPAVLAVPSNGTIHGTLYDDADGNGEQGLGESGLTDVAVFLDANGNYVLDDQTETFGTTESVAILDQKYATSTIVVDTDMEVITDLNITLDITHTRNVHLRAWLVAPDGTQVPLFEQIGRYGQNFENVTFDDSAVDSARDVPEGTITGTLQPFYPLSNFNGLNPNGEWQLKVFDRYTGYTGTLNSWSLEISEREQAAVTDDDGSFSFAGLPDGAYSIVADVAKQYVKQASNVYDYVIADNEVWHAPLAYRTADRNGDGRVSSYELDLVRAYWNESHSEADMNGDGVVNSKDLDEVRSRYVFWMPWFN